MTPTVVNLILMDLAVPGAAWAQTVRAGLVRLVREAPVRIGSVDLAKLESALKSALDEVDADNDGSLNEEEWRSFAGGFGGRGGMGFGGPNGFGGPQQNQNPNAFRAMQILSLQREAQAAALKAEKEGKTTADWTPEVEEEP